MSFKKLIFIVTVGASMFLYQSCDKVKDFGNINQNPNSTTSPITSALLTNVLASIGNNLVFDQGGLSTVSGLYAQLFSETQYTEASRYAKPTFNFDGYYSGPLYDLQNIINYNTDAATAGTAAAYGSNKNQIAVARILKAYYFFFLTSTFGDIPYSLALQGAGNIAYDKQETIIPSLIKELKEAVDQFDAGASFKGDILFNGNNAKWKKFANSIRLLIALQIAKKDPGTGKTEFNAALTHSAGIIATNADNATLVYPGGVYNHPLYQLYNITQRFDYAVSKTVTDFLTSNSDPRINALASSNIGFPYGLTRDAAVAFANANTNYAKVLAPQYRQSTSPIVIMGAANITLARAEAAFRGWTSESMNALYSLGIQQSMDQWSVYNAGTFPGYIAQPSIALTAGSELQKIATQEWIAWFPNGWQAFNVWRRTGFPVLAPAPGTTAIPRRIPYGPTEYNLNLPNVTEAASKYNLGGIADSQFGRVWFDQ
jgi:hypothetical protein